LFSTPPPPPPPTKAEYFKHFNQKTNSEIKKKNSRDTNIANFFHEFLFFLKKKVKLEGKILEILTLQFILFYFFKIQLKKTLGYFEPFNKLKKKKKCNNTI
jgi:hypothetical protein